MMKMAFAYYKGIDTNIDFENGNMFSFIHSASAMNILAEANTGVFLSYDMNEPGENAMVGLAETVIGFMFKEEMSDDVYPHLMNV